MQKNILISLDKVSQITAIAERKSSFQLVKNYVWRNLFGFPVRIPTFVSLKSSYELDNCWVFPEKDIFDYDFFFNNFKDTFLKDDGIIYEKPRIILELPTENIHAAIFFNTDAEMMKMYRTLKDNPISFTSRFIQVDKVLNY